MAITSVIESAPHKETCGYPCTSELARQASKLVSMGIGEKVEILMRERGWNLQELAARVRAQGAKNVKYQHLQQLRDFPNRKPQYLLELAATFGMTAEEFMAWRPASDTGPSAGEQARTRLRPIVTWDEASELHSDGHVIIPRVMVKFSAGSGGPRWEPDPDPAQGQAFRAGFIKREGLKKAQLMSAYASGDSMEPRIIDGDSILIDTGKTEVRDGHVYAIAWDEDLRVKRLFRTPGGGLLIRSDNRDKYPEFEIPADRLSGVVIIGQVIHISGKI